MILKNKINKWMLYLGVIFFLIIISTVSLTSNNSIGFMRWMAIGLTAISAMRITFFIVLILGWKPIMQMLSNKYHWSAEFFEVVMALRMKFFMIVAAYEVLIAQNFIGNVVGFFN